MTQEEKIKELKEMATAYSCALEFDNCPSESSAEYIIDNLFDHDKEELKKILRKYSGWSCSDLESSVFMKIKHL